MLAELNNIKMSAASDDINSLYSSNTLITPPLFLLSDSTALGVVAPRLESVGRGDRRCEERPFQGFQDLKDAQSFHFYKQVDQFSNCSSDSLCGISQVLPSGAPISAGPEMGPTRCLPEMTRVYGHQEGETSLVFWTRKLTPTETKEKTGGKVRLTSLTKEWFLLWMCLISY